MAASFGRGPLPSSVNRGNHPLFRIQQQDRSAVGYTDPDHDTRLVGDDRVPLQAEEVAEIVIGLIDDQDVVAMHLFDGDQAHPG